MTSFLRGAWTTVTLQLSAYGLSVLTSLVLARSFGKVVLGAYGTVSAVSMIFVLVGGFGLQFAIPYLVARDPSQLASLVGSSLALLLPVGISVAAGASIGAHLVARFVLPGVEPALISAGGIVVAATLLSQNAQMVLLGQRRFAAYNTVSVVSAALLLALLAGAALAQQVTQTAVGVAWAASSIGAASVAARQLYQLGAFRLGIRTEQMATALSIARRALVTNAISLLVWRVDVLLVNVMRGSSAAGEYVVAVSISELLVKLPMFAAASLFPFVAAGDHQAVEVTARLTRSVIAFVVVLGCVVGFTAHTIVGVLFGQGYSSSYTALLLLLPGAVAWGVQVVLNNYFAGRGYPPVAWAAGSVALTVDALGNLISVPALGIDGAAASATASYILWALLLLFAFCRDTGTSPAALLVPRLGDLTDVLRAAAIRAGVRTRA